MRIFSICNEDGNVIDVVSAKTFEEAYKNTVGLNNGELLVEIDKQVFKKIENFKENKAHFNSSKKTSSKTCFLFA